MNAPLPQEFAHEYMKLARREAYLRGLISGVVATVVVAIVAVGLMFWPSFAKAQVPRAAEAYKRDLIRYGTFVWGLGAPTSTFAAQIHQESGWREDARSPVGAIGIAQFMPRTASWIKDVYPSELSGDVRSADWGLRALVRYDRYLFERVKGLNLCEQMAFALGSYNGGLGWMFRRKEKSDDPLVCLFSTCDINPGITPANQAENAGYSRRILLTIEPRYVAAGWGPGSCNR